MGVCALPKSPTIAPCRICFPDQFAAWEQARGAAPSAPVVPRTQKARGLAALVSSRRYGVPQYRLAQTAEAIGESLGGLNFARPCPATPRHGFVDSRKVADVGEARALLAETQQIDPEAELLLMQPIQAAASAVITATSATIGPGNAGATGGNDCLTIPLVAMDTRVPREASGVRESEYVEVVYDKNGGAWFVQLRDGPGAPRSVDYKPRAMTIGRIIKATGDLLRWERLMNEAGAAPEQGVVVSHVGGSLTSHYAAHAIKNKVPVIVSHEPAVGDYLLADTQTTPPYNVAKFKRGVVQGFARMHLDDHGAMINLILLATHHASVAQTPTGSWLLGYAAALLVRYGVAAALGEARHANPRQKVERNAIYRDALGDPLAALAKIKRTHTLFRNHRWSSGIGGDAWALCVEATVALDKALQKAYRRGISRSIEALIPHMHNVVNCVHNGGWWLNKFCGRSEFTAHAQAFVGQIAKALFVVWKEREAADTGINFALAQVVTAAWARRRGAKITPTTKASVPPPGEEEPSEEEEKQEAEPVKPLLVPYIGPPMVQIALIGGHDLAKGIAPVAHVQIGGPGAYFSLDLPVPAERFEEFKAWLDSAATVVSTSFSGSDTTYFQVLPDTPIPPWFYEALMAEPVVEALNKPLDILKLEE